MNEESKFSFSHFRADWTSFRCIAFNAYERACYRKFSLDIGFSTGTLPENVRKSLVVEKVSLLVLFLGS
jgi:hypothetical protein